MIEITTKEIPIEEELKSKIVFIFFSINFLKKVKLLVMHML